MILWIRARQLHIYGVVALVAAVLAGLLTQTYVSVPTLFGILIPVVISSISSVVFAVFILSALRPLSCERVSTRRLKIKNVLAVLILSSPATAIALVTSSGLVGGRCILGMSGIALLLAKFTRPPWGALTVILYFVVCATLGHSNTGDVLAAQSWAWIVDGTRDKQPFYIAASLLGVGIVVHLVGRDGSAWSGGSVTLD